jgi:hypothetical protein
MKTKLLASLILFTFCAKLNAQWIQTNGPYGGQTTAIASNATDLFATFSYGKISHSIDNGSHGLTLVMVLVVIPFNV